MIYIANGVDVDPTWVNVIALSADGINWDTINKDNLSVGQVYTKDVAVGSRFANKTKIVLKTAGDEPVTFDTQDVKEGAALGEHTGWQGGDQASLRAASIEINSWL